MKKGDTRVINGDRWTVVDVAPAEQLAEMVAGLLEEEGFVVMTRSQDALSHLGAAAIGTAFVLVPEADAQRALDLIAETVTDYEGEDLAAILGELGSEVTPEELEALGVDIDGLTEGTPAEDAEAGGDDGNGS